MTNQTTSRRGFLKAAVLTTAAAATVGGGAAVLKEQMTPDPLPVIALSNKSAQATQPLQTAQSPAIQQPAATQATLSNAGTGGASQVATDLASAQIENSRLQTELALARQRIAELEGNVSGGNDANKELRMQLDEAVQRLGVMTGLVALYEQFEDGALIDTLGSGMQAVGQQISAVVDDIPNVNESLAVGHNALNSFESNIPLIEGARLWLLGHIDRLWLLYVVVERMVALAADNVGPVVELMAQWVENVVKWLPFGLGQRSLDLVNAVSDLLAATPETVSGARSNVIAPLESWLGQPDGETPLLSELVQPLRETALRSAQDHLVKTSVLNRDYQANVAAPLQAAVEQRRAILEDIIAYRQQHGI